MKNLIALFYSIIICAYANAQFNVDNLHEFNSEPDATFVELYSILPDSLIALVNYPDGGAIITSQDSGKSWSLEYKEPNSEFFKFSWRFDVNSNNNIILIAADHGRVFKLNHELNWIETLQLPAPYDTMDVHNHDMDGGIYLYKNNHHIILAPDDTGGYYPLYDTLLQENLPFSTYSSRFYGENKIIGSVGSDTIYDFTDRLPQLENELDFLGIMDGFYFGGDQENSNNGTIIRGLGAGIGLVKTQIPNMCVTAIFSYSNEIPRVLFGTDGQVAFRKSQIDTFTVDTLPNNHTITFFRSLSPFYGYGITEQGKLLVYQADSLPRLVLNEFLIYDTLYSVISAKAGLTDLTPNTKVKAWVVEEGLLVDSAVLFDGNASNHKVPIDYVFQVSRNKHYKVFMEASNINGSVIDSFPEMSTRSDIPNHNFIHGYNDFQRPDIPYWSTTGLILSLDDFDNNIQLIGSRDGIYSTHHYLSTLSNGDITWEGTEGGMSSSGVAGNLRLDCQIHMPYDTGIVLIKYVQNGQIIDRDFELLFGDFSGVKVVSVDSASLVQSDSIIIVVSTHDLRRNIYDLKTSGTLVVNNIGFSQSNGALQNDSLQHVPGNYSDVISQWYGANDFVPIGVIQDNLYHIDNYREGLNIEVKRDSNGIHNAAISTNIKVFESSPSFPVSRRHQYFYLEGYEKWEYSGDTLFIEVELFHTGQLIGTAKVMNPQTYTFAPIDYTSTLVPDSGNIRIYTRGNNASLKRSSWYINNLSFDTFYQNVLSSEETPLETKEEAGLKLFPNPTEGLVNIQLNKPVIDQQKIQVYNLQGQLVKEEVMVSGESIKLIDLNNLPKALYLIVLPGEKLRTGKVLLR